MEEREGRGRELRGSIQEHSPTARHGLAGEGRPRPARGSQTQTHGAVCQQESGGAPARPGAGEGQTREKGQRAQWVGARAGGQEGTDLCELSRAVEGHGCSGSGPCREVITGSLRNTESPCQQSAVTAVCSLCEHRHYSWGTVYSALSKPLKQVEDTSRNTGFNYVKVHGKMVRRKAACREKCLKTRTCRNEECTAPRRPISVDFKQLVNIFDYFRPPVSSYQIQCFSMQIKRSREAFY